MKQRNRDTHRYDIDAKRKTPAERVRMIIAMIVVFVTVYTLIMPAIAIEKKSAEDMPGLDAGADGTSGSYELSCPFAVHQHTDACYEEQDVLDAYGNPTGEKQKVLICGKADWVVHEHDAGCYQDGVLVCTLPEIKAHQHDKKCYEAQQVLTCQLPETDGHQHTDSCYSESQELTCTIPEHIHTDACYSDVVVSSKEVLTCGYNEGEVISPAEYSEAVTDEETGEVIEEPQLIREEVVHHHDSSCYRTEEQTERQLTCGMEEHTHSDACYRTDRALVCGLEETPGHHHTDACYTEQKIPVCGEIEPHTHTIECYEKGPNDESPEDMGWVSYIEDENGNRVLNGDPKHLICGKPELLVHQHGAECFRTVENAAEEEGEIIAEGAGGNSDENAGDPDSAGLTGAENAAADAGEGEAADGKGRDGWIYLNEDEEADQKDADGQEEEEQEIDEQEADEQEVPAGPFTRTAEVEVDGAPYTLSVQFTNESGLPENAIFKAVALTEEQENYQAYQDKAFSSVEECANEGENGHSRAEKMLGLFDITIFDEDGTVIEPSAPISVTVNFGEEIDTNENGGIYAVHFPGTGLQKNESLGSADDSQEGREGQTQEGDPEEQKGNDAEVTAEALMEMLTEGLRESGLFTESAKIANTDVEVIETSVENGQEITFEAGGFSVYAVVYTVDFHWKVAGEVYDFSIPGGGFVSLGHLVERLGIVSGNSSAAENTGDIEEHFSDDNIAVSDSIDDAAEINAQDISEWTKKFVEEVDSVSFSDDTLIWVGKTDTDTTIGSLKDVNKLKCEYSAELTEEQIAELDAQKIWAGDWALISLKPFETEEMLTVTMKDGDVFRIRVTDAQISSNVLTADGKTYKITVTFDDQAGIPVGTKLVVSEIMPDTDEYIQHLGQVWHEVNKEYLEQEARMNNVPDGIDDYKDIRPINLDDARFFNITLMYNGEPIEPNSPVQVDIQYTDGLKTDAENVISGVVHFKEIEEDKPAEIEVIEEVDTAEGEEGDIVEFTYMQDSFSDIGTFAGQETFDGGPISFEPTIDLPFLKAQRSTTETGLDTPAAEKRLDPNKDSNGNEDGTYTLSLSVTGQAVESSSMTKANVLFIMDRSSSMTENVYEKHEGPPVGGQTYYGQNAVGSFITLQTSFGRYYYPNLYTEYTGNVYTKTKTTRLQAEQTAMRTLLGDLLDKNEDYPGTVEISIISFADTRGDQETTTTSGGTWNTSVTETPWNHDSATLLNAVNATETHSGTNWEEALIYAQEKIGELPADRKDEKTYVIFLTDGEPTAIHGETGGAHHYDNSSGQPIYNGDAYGYHYDGVDYTLGGFEYAYKPARDDARDIVEAGYNFYTVMTFNPLVSANKFLKRLTNYAYDFDGDGVGGSSIDSGDDVDTAGEILNNYYFNAATPEELTDAFGNIFKAVSNGLAHGQVKITDGMTAGAMTSTFVSGSPSGVRYVVSKKDENDEDVEQYSVTAEKDPNNENEPIVTFYINGEDYSTTDTGDQKVNKVTNPDDAYDKGTYYTITVGDVEYKMALASIVKKSDTEDTLTWDLTPIGTLWGDCTYTAEFIVWPNQDAYDYVAALNNGLEQITNSDNETVNVEWKHTYAEPVRDPDTDEIKYYKGGCEDYPSIVYYPGRDDDYEYGVYNGIFAVLTNTEQSLDYSIVTTENGEVTSCEPQPQIPLKTPEPMKLTAAGSRVSKLWNISRDPDALLRLLYEFDGDMPKVDENGDPIPKKYTVPVLDEETGEPVIDEETGEPVTKTYNGFFIDFKILQDTADPTGEAYRTVKLGWDEEKNKYVWYEGGEEGGEGNEEESEYVKTKTYGEGENAVTLTYGTRWEQDFSIATGLMLTRERLLALKLDPDDYAHGKYPDDETGTTYYLLEDGHDYTLSEPELGYEFDFDAPTYHPMLVDGVMKSVRFTKDPETNTISISKIEDLKISSDGTSLLEIINTLRGYIHVKKTVTADPGIDTSEDETKFTYDVNLYNNDGAFTTEGAHIPWYGINELFYHTEIENLEGEKEYEYYQAQAIGMADDGIHGLLTLTDEEGNTYTATCVGEFDEDTVGPTYVTFEVDGANRTIQLYGNQMDFHEADIIEGTDAYRRVHATFMITKDQTLNIANVPVSTRYEITERDERGYEFVNVASTASAEADGKQITGTIVPNSDTTITYTNKALTADLRLKKLVRINEFDPQGDQVSDANKTLADGTYTITVVGKEGTDAEGKSYEVQIGVDNSGDSTVYTLKGFSGTSTPAGSGEGGENADPNPASAVLLTDGTVLLKNLPFGEYTVTEAEPGGSVVCIGVYCSDYSVSPNVDNRTVGVEVKPGETEENSKLVQYTNNLTNAGDDIAHVSVRKTFEGLPPNKIPKDFQINVTVTAVIDGRTRTFHYTLKGKDAQPDGVVFNSSVVDGNVVWNWRIAIAGLKPDAVLNVVEEGYERKGYDVTPSVNGHYGTEFNGTVSADTVVLSINPHVISEQNVNTFSVYDYGDSSKIFIARLPSDNKTALVISSKRLTLSEKKKIEYMLQHSMSKGGDWTWGGHDVLYYNFEEAGNNEIRVRDALVTYSENNGGEVTFHGQYQWTHVGTAEIVYQPGRPADVNFVNSYNEDAVNLDIFKTEKGSSPAKMLAGAAFTLKELQDVPPVTEGGMLAYVDGSERVSPRTNADGKTGFNGLTHGYYELTETQLPTGYIQPEEMVIYFKVEDGAVTFLEKGDGAPSTWTSASDNDTVSFTAARDAVTDDPATPENEARPAANAAFTIGNTPGAQLPNSGGPGTILLYLFGVILAGLAGAGLAARKRRSAA